MLRKKQLLVDLESRTRRSRLVFYRRRPLVATQPQLLRLSFGPFEVDVQAGVVRKHGVRLRLSGQPLRILLILLTHAGEPVTREQLREQIWGEGTFVDFEH